MRFSQPNLTHIAHASATLGLIAGRSLPAWCRVAILLIYGPFNERGRFTGPGNAALRCHSAQAETRTGACATAR